MSIEQRVSESIRHAADQQPAPAFDLAGIRRDARRRTAARTVGVAAAAAVVVAGLVSVGLTRDDDTTQPPAEQPSPSQTPTPSPSSTAAADPYEIPDVRGEQVVVTWDQPPSQPSVQTLVGRETSDDPGGSDGEVSVTGPVFAYMQLDGFGWEKYCSGAPGTWWVFTVEPEISFLDSGRCDGSGQPTSAPPASSLDGPFVGSPQDLPGRATDVEVRMFLTDQDPAAYVQCVAYSPPGGCRDLQPTRAVGTGAQFGVTMYAREPLAPATTIFGSAVYPAARWGGATYSFTTAVAAATGSRVLTYELPPSDHERVVQAMAGQAEPCRHADGIRTASCLPPPRLSIDGVLVENGAEGLLSTVAARTTVAPGAAHEVTLEIPAQDADLLDLGFVVFEARD